jgi:hypothetical protein
MKLEDFKPEEGLTVEGKVESIDIKRADEVFGEDAINPEKSIAVLTVKVEGSSEPVRANLPLPKGLVYLKAADQWEITDKVAYIRSVRNPASKFSMFLKKYGVPHVGTAITVKMNEQGFFEPVL